MDKPRLTEHVWRGLMTMERWCAPLQDEMLMYSLEAGERRELQRAAKWMAETRQWRNARDEEGRQPTLIV